VKVFNTLIEVSNSVHEMVYLVFGHIRGLLMRNLLTGRFDQ